MAFGILWLLGHLCLRGVAEVQNAIDNEWYRKTTDNGFTYSDNHGGTFLSSNGHRVRTEHMFKYSTGEWCCPVIDDGSFERGDTVLIDTVTKRVVRNYTREQKKEYEEREKRYEIEHDKEQKLKAIANNCTVYETLHCRKVNYDHRPMDSAYGKIYGEFCRDVNTDDVYVLRYINGIIYYFDINTFHIVRKADNFYDYKGDTKKLRTDIENLKNKIPEISKANWFEGKEAALYKCKEALADYELKWNDCIDIEAFNKELDKYLQYALTEKTDLWWFTIEGNKDKITDYRPGNLVKYI